MFTNFPKNILLHGVSGTGKTLKALLISLAIIENKSYPEIYQEYLAEENFLSTRLEKHKASGHLEMVSFHKNFTYQDFVETIRLKSSRSRTDDGEDNEDSADLRGGEYEIKPGILKQIADNARNYKKFAFFFNDLAQNSDRHVLFIDELDQGNLSEIFGEILALLPEDKRIGGQNELSLRLPFSRDSFSLPGNLYFVATAGILSWEKYQLLQKRFSLLESKPDCQLLNNEKFILNGIDAAELLRKINARIKALSGSDYLIGQKIFLAIKNKKEPLAELKNIFAEKIIPHLQFIFNDDWEKIGLILGNNFVREISQENIFAKFNSVCFEPPKIVFSLQAIEDLELKDFLTIYT